MSASAHRYSCDQLGACQSRSTPCAGRSHPFAPGVITRHTRSTALQRRALARWPRRVAVFIPTVAALAFLAGLITGAMQ